MEVLSQADILIRLMITLVICTILGLERELKSQPAGIRTHILIGVGSCLLMILSIMVPELYNSNNNDPGRIAAQVVSGVGFLGAGAIMKMGYDTKGLTTAANIWVTAAIGLTIGAGLYMAGITTACIILLNLILITKFKKYYLIPFRHCVISLEVSKKGIDAESIFSAIKLLPISIVSKNIKETDKGFHLTIVSKIKKTENIFMIKEAIKKIAPIDKLSISESIKS